MSNREALENQIIDLKLDQSFSEDWHMESIKETTTRDVPYSSLNLWDLKLFPLLLRSSCLKILQYKLESKHVLICKKALLH